MFQKSVLVFKCKLIKNSYIKILGTRSFNVVKASNIYKLSLANVLKSLPTFLVNSNRIFNIGMLTPQRDGISPPCNSSCRNDKNYHNYNVTVASKNKTKLLETLFGCGNHGFISDRVECLNIPVERTIRMQLFLFFEKSKGEYLWT